MWKAQRDKVDFLQNNKLSKLRRQKASFENKIYRQLNCQKPQYFIPREIPKFELEDLYTDFKELPVKLQGPKADTFHRRIMSTSDERYIRADAVLFVNQPNPTFDASISKKNTLNDKKQQNQTQSLNSSAINRKNQNQQNQNQTANQQIKEREEILLIYNRPKTEVQLSGKVSSNPNLNQNNNIVSYRK